MGSITPSSGPVELTLFDDTLPAAPEGPLVRVRMVIAYDGAPFHGAAENPGVRTVMGTLREAIERVLRHQIEPTIAGRTDRGVHATAQVVTFDARAEGLDPDLLARAVTRLCSPSIVVRDCAVVDDDVDARFSATGRRYRYTLLVDDVPDPLSAGRVWHVSPPLDLSAMRLACDPLIGERDFSSFCRRPRTDAEVSLVRRVRQASWTVDGNRWTFEIEANAFCNQMVRSIVGLLVSVGQGRVRAGEVMGILNARDRAAVSTVAPPDGLVLVDVAYADGWRSGR